MGVVTNDRAYTAVEEALLAKVLAGIEGVDDPWKAIGVGVEVFLAECCNPAFTRIALEEAPVALEWDRWKVDEEKYLLGLVNSALNALAKAEVITIPDEGDLTGRVLLAALDEAGIASAASSDPQAERVRASDLIQRLLSGLRL